VEIIAAGTRQNLPFRGNFCRAEAYPANFRWDTFSGLSQNPCLSDSESSAARRLPIGHPGKTPNEPVAQYQNGETNVI
jgi:hypothetical protein